MPVEDGVNEQSGVPLQGPYGHAAQEVMEMAAASPELAERITPELPDLVAEAAFAARREQTRSLADVLIRRTRLGLLDARTLCADGADGPERAARAMAPELGWDEAQVEAELDDWTEVARAEGFVPGASGGRREA